MKVLLLLLVLLAAVPAALAGGVITYPSYPPIVAGVGMDRHYVAPGGQVHLQAVAAFGVGSGYSIELGGPAYDNDTEYVDGGYAALVDDPVHVTSWQVKDQNGVSGGTLATTGALTATWTAPSGLPSYPATYTVTMVVDDYATRGSSSNDAPVTRTATIIISPVNPVSYLSARPMGSTGVTLEWNAPDGGAQSYKIFRRTDPNTPYSTTPIHQASTTSWTDTNVTEGTTYYYQIRATNNGNDGPPSPEVIGTPEAEQPTAVAYVANSLANNVLVVDTTTDQVYATIAVGKTFADPGSIGPLGVAVSPDGSRVYVTNMNQETVSIIEAATNRELDIDGMSATTDPLDSPPGISRVKLRTTEDAGQPLAPDGVVVAPDNSFAFVADFAGGSDANRSGSIASVSTADNSVSKPVASGITHPTRLALTPDGSTMYVPDAGGSGDRNNNVLAVNVSDPSNPYVSATVSLTAASMPNGRAPRPQGVAVAQTASGTYAYLVNSMGQSVSVIDTASNGVVATITIPKEPSISTSAPYPLEAAATEDGAYVFVTGSQPGTDGHSHSVVWVIDTSTNTVAAQQALVDGTQPLYGAGRIAVMNDGAGYKAYITNFGDFLPNSTGRRLSVLMWAYDDTQVQYVLTQSLTIHTGDNSGPGGIAARAVAPVTPYDFNVYGTGSQKLTLFWRGVPGATGYNIYRGTSAGSANTLVASNVSSQYFPGSEMYMYSDTGGALTDGVEYFYLVKAQLATGESKPSIEASDSPAAGAIPWDTRDVGSVLSAFRGAFSEEDLSGIPLRIVGPDGWIYESGFGSPQPPDGEVFNNNSQILYPDGTVETLPNSFDQEVNDVSGSGASISPSTYGHFGPFRRTRTKPSYRGSRGDLDLPSLSDMDIRNPAIDVAYIYLGVSVPDPKLIYDPVANSSSEVDAGLQWSTPIPGNYNTGKWAAVMNINRRYVTGDPSKTNRQQPLGPATVRARVNRPKGNPRFEPGQRVTLTYYSYGTYGNVPAKLSLLIVDGTLYGSEDSIRALGGATAVYTQSHNARMKRMASIAQPNDDSVKPPHGKIIRTGSSMAHVSWSSGQLLSNGSWGLWGGPGITDEDVKYTGENNDASVASALYFPGYQENDLNITIQPPCIFCP